MRAVPALALDHVPAAAAPRQLVAVGLLALVMATLGALRLSDLRAEQQSLTLRSERSPARPQAGQVAPVALPPAPPWDKVFGALEMASGPDLSLLAFDPAPERQRLRLEGEARNLQALLDYMRRLGATPPFVRAELQSHQASRDEPWHPVRFVLELSWRQGT